MTKYRVPLKIIFNGCALIEADSEEKAEELATYHVGAVIGNVSDDGADCVINTEFDLHGETERRDNESIEEVEDEDLQELRK